MGDLYKFLKSCYDHIAAKKVDYENVIPFVVASNDGLEFVYYAEGMIHNEPQKALGLKLGFVFKGQGILYKNIDRFADGFKSRPFAPQASRKTDLTIRVVSQPRPRITFEVEGMTIVNPNFEPRYALSPADRIYAGVLYGLEEVPAIEEDKERYPKTLWTLSLKQTSRQIIVPEVANVVDGFEAAAETKFYHRIT